jgi:hypothetical protein
MRALSWHKLRRFATAGSGPSRERLHDRAAASPGDERFARLCRNILSRLAELRLSAGV